MIKRVRTKATGDMGRGCAGCLYDGDSKPCPEELEACYENGQDYIFIEVPDVPEVELKEALSICYYALRELSDNEQVHDDVNGKKMSFEAIRALIDGER